jgi:hypothetical protein
VFHRTCLVPRTRRLATALAAALALALSCREPAPPPPPPPPTVAATVLVYETSVAPENRTFRWQVLTDGTRVRFGDDAESWRLFDMAARTVTFVDETRRSWRSRSFDDVLAARGALLETPLPDATPRARVSEEPLGVAEGREVIGIRVEAGGYRRLLVVSKAPMLPAGSLALKWATDPLEPTNAGMLRDFLPALLGKEGTTVSDRNELTWEGGSMSVETKLVSVRPNIVPKSIFEVPAGFRRAEP